MEKHAVPKKEAESKTSIKRLIIYIIILTVILICTILASVVASFAVSTSINIDSAAKYTSDHAARSENIIETELYSFLMHNLERYLKLSSYALFFENNDSAEKFLSSIRLELIDNQKLKSQFIKEIVFYRTYDSTVVSSRISAYSLQLSGNDSFKDIIKIVESGAFYSPYFVNTPEGELIYLYPVVNPNHSSNNFLGFAAIYLKPAAIFTTDIGSFESEAAFLVLNTDNMFISVQGNNIYSNDIISDILNSYIPNTPIFKNIHSSRYFFYYYTGSSGIKYLFYTPSSTILAPFGIAPEHRLLLLISLFAVIIFYIIAVILLATQLAHEYKPIPSDAKQPDLPGHTYERFKHIIDLLYGNSDINDLQYTLMEHFGTQALNGLFSVSVIKCDEVYIHSLTSIQKQNLNERILRAVENYFTDSNIAALTVLHPQTCITSILYITNDHSADDIKAGLTSALGDERECGWDAVVSPPSAVITDIQASFAAIIGTSLHQAEIVTEDTAAAESAAAAEEDAEESRHITSINLKYMDSIVAFIDSNIQHITLSLAADKFNISTAHLSRLFKECMDINFSDYVMEKKLQKAVELLVTDKEMSVSDIARELGYNTSTYFSKKFKDKYGMTPVMYRKNEILR